LGTPDFLKIKNKKTKRISPYVESELWDKDELLSILKYDQKSFKNYYL
jgi:hypothetical protein